METEITPEHFKFSTAILRRLGEELNPHPDQGIIELIRNAYDADAINCKIQLNKVNKKGGSIQIIDDGHGMDLDAIKNGWLLLGRSEKMHRRRTPLGRRPVGDKGLGRLAAMRMGNRAILITRPKTAPLFEHKLVIDWTKYDSVEVVEDVTLEIETVGTTQSNKFGTEILIEDLKSSLGEKEVGRLARSLLLLADPFDNPTGFHTVLNAPEFKRLEKILKKKYFSDAEYHLIAELSPKGSAKAFVLDSHGREIWSGNHKDLRGEKEKLYNAPSAKFEFWAFNLGSEKFLPRTTPLSDIRSWLRAVGGVHFYHRGLRVYPYGDPGHDWLDINLRRAQSPELRPSTNNSIGRFSVEDPGDQLLQKTDRTGFVEDTHFEELRSFAQDALEWLAMCRLEKREKERADKRTSANRIIKAAKKAMDQVIAEAPHASQETIKRVFNQYEVATKQQVTALKEEVQLYRTLSTVGTTFAVLSHELKSPLTRIKQMTEIIREKYPDTLKKPLDLITKSAMAVVAFPALAMKLLEREKRQEKPLGINTEILEVLNMFEPFLNEAKVTPKHEFVDVEPYVLSSKALLQSVFVNLLTNSMNAFFVNRKQNLPRTVLFRTSISDNKVRINVLDNGPGIQGLSIKEIWLPGKTTYPNGTGLGLTIVRDTVLDLGGQCYAIAQGELGGAEIVIELPITEDKP
ncbi:MAG: sensor histidine kinase [Sedimentisphaerales bacterium]|jgi:signal transduction histidine kinase